jgi:hypothetical protein
MTDFIKGENLMFADKVKKTNMFNWSQNRTFAITESKIYNIKKMPIRIKMKRAINIIDIDGISRIDNPQKPCKEFTIHVAHSYDYRFESDRRD